MYLPKSKIKDNLYTNGGEFQTLNTKEEYFGEYFKTSKGGFFSGKPNNPVIVKLTKITDSSEMDVDFNSPSSSSGDNSGFIVPNSYRESVNLSLPEDGILYPQNYPETKTNIEIIEKFTSRHFLKKSNEMVFFSINEELYLKIINMEPNTLYYLYKPFKIQWKVEGSMSEIITHNEATTIKINKNYPGFLKFINKDYDSFSRFDPRMR